MCPKARIRGVRPTEFYSQNFEENGADFGSTVVRDNSKPHTGKYSGKITNAGSAEVIGHSEHYLFLDSSSPRKYTYSGWVYSNGPSTQLFLFMYNATEGGYFTYSDAVGTSVINKWTYISKTFTLQTDVVKLRLRIDNN